jgi:hypothetical protein
MKVEYERNVDYDGVKITITLTGPEIARSHLGGPAIFQMVRKYLKFLLDYDPDQERIGG